MEFYYKNRYLKTATTVDALVLEGLGLSSSDVYFIHNGRLSAPERLTSGTVHIVQRLPGGKGGFGSMLRAIGAQIEKTTNREACRDLSGRRLRDINEEKRLQNWIDQQAEREKEAADKKQKKLERLCEKPRHEFKDESYDKEREELPDRIESAVEQGMMAAASGSGHASVKRKLEEDDKKKKKRKIWMEDDMSDLSSSSGSEDEKLPEADCSDVKIKSESVDQKDSSTKCTEKVIDVK